jgi:hypothetical protein
MRPRLFTFLLSALLALAAAPVYGDDLTFALTPNTGAGSPTSNSPYPGNCIPPNCVLFSGTLTDTDTDGSYIFFDYFPIDISVTFSSSPVSGSLSLDSTFYEDVPLLLSGDPTWATDLLGNPPNIYGPDLPIFGIDIAPGTSVGEYSGTVTINAAGGTNDPDFNGFTVSQSFTVDVVAPEPAAAGLLLGGLLALAAWCGVKRKWRSSEAPSR